MERAGLRKSNGLLSFCFIEQLWLERVLLIFAKIDFELLPDRGHGNRASLLWVPCSFWECVAKCLMEFGEVPVRFVVHTKRATTRCCVYFGP